MLTKTLILFLLIGCLLILISEYSNRTQTRYSSSFKKSINTLVDQTAELATQSSQDANTLVSLVNSSRAMARVDVLKSIASEKDLNILTGVSVKQLEEQTKIYYNASLQKLFKTCPNASATGTLAELANLKPKTRPL